MRIKYVPVSQWTMIEKGSKSVELEGVNDKRQMTAVSSLVIFDKIKGQTMEKVLSCLDESNILYVMVPPYCTDQLQLLDVCVHKPDNRFSKGKIS